MDAQRRQPVAQRLRQGLDRAHQAEAGVVEQDVDPAEALRV
ncbi:hypothetical protein [Azospirillum sp. ST 5-10]